MQIDNSNILVLGANGQVGRELAKRADNFNINVKALSRLELDITKSEDVASVLQRIGPKILINAVAYTAVDDAESQSEIAFNVNRDAVETLAKNCAKFSIPLIHLSTDYVFDGKKSGAYLEDDPVCPMGVYGRSKEAGEAHLRDIIDEHIIIRTSWVYSAHGNNFLRTMLRLATERDELNIVEDQKGVPTFAGDIADALLSIVQRLTLGKHEKVWGTFHYTAKNPTTWRGFADEIFNQIRNYDMAVPVVNGIPSSQYPTPASRPLNSVLNCDKIERVFDVPRRSWREGMLEVIDQLLKDEQQ